MFFNEAQLLWSLTFYHFETTDIGFSAENHKPRRNRSSDYLASQSGKTTRVPPSPGLFSAGKWFENETISPESRVLQLWWSGQTHSTNSCFQFRLLFFFCQNPDAELMSVMICMNPCPLEFELCPFAQNPENNAEQTDWIDDAEFRNPIFFQVYIFRW